MLTTTTVLWGLFVLMMMVVIYGAISAFSVYDRIGHSGLSLDAGYGDEIDDLVREARK